MKGVTAVVFAFMLLVSSALAQTTATVDKKGQSSKIELEQSISGYLTELNGKYKLRISETVYEPGGYIVLLRHTEDRRIRVRPNGPNCTRADDPAGALSE